MDTFETFPLILNLLWIWEIAQSQPAIIQGGTALLLDCELIKIRHGVGLGNFSLFRWLIQITLHQRTILTIMPLCPIVESGRDCRLLFR